MNPPAGSFSNQGWHFEVSESGPEGSCVILLHGFPADRQCWDAVAAQLNAAGRRTLAPDQRGYSPGARPPDRQSYRMAALVGDVLALADQRGVVRFDVVGHDWGAVVAWHLAARCPARVRSLTALSVPHPGAMAQAARHLDQLRRSWYVAAFQVPAVAERLLALQGGDVFRRTLEHSGLAGPTATRYAQRAAHQAMTGPLNWYRALPLDLGHPVARVEVPTLFVWGDQDGFVSRRAADACHLWTTGPWQLEVLAGVSHWLPEMAAAQIGALILEHLEGLEDRPGTPPLTARGRDEANIADSSTTVRREDWHRKPWSPARERSIG